MRWHLQNAAQVASTSARNASSVQIRPPASQSERTTRTGLEVLFIAGSRDYQVHGRADGSLGCTCPAWRFNKNRICKHSIRAAQELGVLRR